jgi:hypothetical protein
MHALERFGIAGDDEVGMQPPDIVIGQRFASGHALFELVAQSRIDAGDMLIPEGIGLRVVGGPMLRHQRQRQAQDLSALFFGLFVSHCRA